MLRGVAQLVEYTLWERGVAGSSPVSPIGGTMEKKDNLPHIIAGIALIIYLVFIFTISRSTIDEPIEGGNIQRAIETGQYY